LADPNAEAKNGKAPMPSRNDMAWLLLIDVVSRADKATFDPLSLWERARVRAF